MLAQLEEEMHIGPDLRVAQGPGPQASHKQRTSHQTLHILFLAHDSRLRNCDLVLMHACVRHASARLFSFIDQFIASLDQRLQAYKLLAGQFGCVGCLSTLSPVELLTAAKTVVDLCCGRAHMSDVLL